VLTSVAVAGDLACSPTCGGRTPGKVTRGGQTRAPDVCPNLRACGGNKKRRRGGHGGRAFNEDAAAWGGDGGGGSWGNDGGGDGWWGGSSGGDGAGDAALATWHILSALMLAACVQHVCLTVRFPVERSAHTHRAHRLTRHVDRAGPSSTRECARLASVDCLNSELNTSLVQCPPPLFLCAVL